MASLLKKNQIYIQYMQWNTLDYVPPMGNHMVKKLACPHHLETQYRPRWSLAKLQQMSFYWKIEKNALETGHKLWSLFAKLLKLSDNQSKGEKCIYLFTIWFNNIKVSKASTVWIKEWKW